MLDIVKHTYEHTSKNIHFIFYLFKMINQTIRRFVSFSSITSTNIISRRSYNHNNNLIRRSLSSASFNTSLINVDVKDNGVCVVTLNRPKARNALSTELATQMCGVFQDITDATIKPTDLASVRASTLTALASIWTDLASVCLASRFCT